jgi:hypothetical protein
VVFANSVSMHRCLYGSGRTDFDGGESLVRTIWKGWALKISTFLGPNGTRRGHEKESEGRKEVKFEKIERGGGGQSGGR